MKIIFLIRALTSGGSERQLTMLARALAQRGHSVKVAVFYAEPFFERELKDANVEIVHLGKKGRWDFIGFYFSMAQLIRSHKPDILYSLLTSSNIVATVMKLVYPKMHLVWGIRNESFNPDKEDWFFRMLRWVERLCSQIPSVIIVNSKAGFEAAESQGCRNPNMVVIPNGIDTNIFDYAPLGRAKVRAEWNIPEGQKVIGIVARMDPIKDYETFLRAAAFLTQERGMISFICAGAVVDNRYEKKMRTLARQLKLEPYLIWVGEGKDMPSVYSAMDVLCCSSISEGFPNVIAEAMACGVPCAVTNVGDCAQIVGDYGRVVCSKQPDALKSAILSLLSSPTIDRKMIRQSIVDRFSLQRMVARTEECLLELLDTKGS